MTMTISHRRMLARLAARQRPAAPTPAPDSPAPESPPEVRMPTPLASAQPEESDDSE